VGRIAGDSPGYSYRLCRMIGPVAKPTSHGFTLPSSTEVIGEVLAKPPSAMAWWGYRIGLKALSQALLEDGDEVLQHADTPEDLEEYLKGRGVSPNMSLDSAGDRGNRAHLVVECLAENWAPMGTRDDGNSVTLRDWAEAFAMDEEFTEGTRYGWAGIEWWDAQIQPYIDSGAITNVLSEVPVESLEDLFSGTFDLAVEWSIWNGFPMETPVWEVIDAKTHKPANGFSKPGKGPGYISDAVQMKSYRKAVEEMAARPEIFRSPFPPGAKTVGQRAVILRDRAYKGRSWLEDYRDVPYELFRMLRRAYDIRKEFEKGDE
jgi:hypothetical protein